MVNPFKHSLYRRLTRLTHTFGTRQRPTGAPPNAPTKARSLTLRQHYDQGHPIALEAPALPTEHPTALSASAQPAAAQKEVPTPTAVSPSTAMAMSDDEIAADLSDVFSGAVPSAPDPAPLPRQAPSRPTPEPPPAPSAPKAHAHSIFDRMTEGQEYVTTFDLGRANISQQFSAFEQRLNEEEAPETVPIFEHSPSGYAQAQTLLATPIKGRALADETLAQMADRHHVLPSLFRFWNHFSETHTGPLTADQEYIVGYEDAPQPRNVSVRVTKEIQRSNAVVNSYPTKDKNHLFQVPTYRMVVSGTDNQGSPTSLDFEVIRYGVALGSTSTKNYKTPTVVGLSDPKTYTVDYWKPTYINNSGAYRFHGGHLLHIGAIDPTTTPYGAIGCIEVTGRNAHGDRMWEVFKAYMRELSGLNQEADIAKQQRIQVIFEQVTRAERPTLIKVKKEK